MIDVGGIQFEERRSGVLAPRSFERVNSEWVWYYGERIKEMLKPAENGISPVILAPLDTSSCDFDSRLLEIPPDYVDIWHQDYPDGLSALAIFNKSKNNRRGKTEWRPFGKPGVSMFGGPSVLLDWLENPETVAIINNQTGMHRGVYLPCDSDIDNYLYQLKIF